MILLTVSLETAAQEIYSKCALISPVVKPLAYKDRTTSSTSVSRRCRFLTITGSNMPSRGRGARSGLKMGCGCPPMPLLLGSLGRRLVGHRELRLRVLQCCLEHAS